MLSHKGTPEPDKTELLLKSKIAFLSKYSRVMPAREWQQVVIYRKSSRCGRLVSTCSCPSRRPLCSNRILGYITLAYMTPTNQAGEYLWLALDRWHFDGIRTSSLLVVHLSGKMHQVKLEAINFPCRCCASTILSSYLFHGVH